MVGQIWHHQDILAAVKKRGSSFSDLARQHGYARTTLHASLYRRHPRAHRIIAEFIGVSRHELWPGWYGENDELLPLAAYPGHAA